MEPLRILPGEPPRLAEVLLERTLPSRLDLKQEALDAIAEPLIARGMVLEDDRPWLTLCLDEVLVNAIIHGNEGDPDLTIDVRVACDRQRWSVTVSDRGAGFQASDVPDPSDPESLLLEHGRGIRLLGEWLGELTYYRGGSCAFLARRRADRS